jgi:two-component system, NarL family, nitrate/nitrite response regulator NarL
MSEQKIKVLLVDDHPFVLEGIRSYLLTLEEFEVVGEASNGKEAVEKAQALHPAVVVMDITMPVMNGLEATRFLALSCPDVKVLILSVHEKREFTSQIIEAGARGYVSKNASPAELVRAIKTVHSGETFFAAPLTAAFLREYIESAGRPKAARATEISSREREVLTLIAEGFSNKETAHVLGVSVRTVEKHRERIMDKLDLHSVVELTKYAIANQLVHVGAQSDTPTPRVSL